MPQYRYQLRTNGGETSVGVVSAENALSAAQQLRSQGHTVLQLTPMGKVGAQSLLAKLKGLNYTSGPSQRDILNFTTQLAVMVRAGISLRAAIEGIAEQTENAKFRAMLYQIKQDVESGKQFSEALARHPHQFGPLYVNMVRASEMSGSFSQMLERVAAYLAHQIETRNMVVGAMIYPVCHRHVGGGGDDLPAHVRAAAIRGRVRRQGSGHALADDLPDEPVRVHGALVVGGVAGAGGYAWAACFSLCAPIRAAGGLMPRSCACRSSARCSARLYISRSLHTMGELVNAGVPMLDTLAITGEISGNRLYKRMWHGVYHSVKQGKKIASPLYKSVLLPKPVVQMVSAGEESGKLGEVLDDVSDVLFQAVARHDQDGHQHDRADHDYFHGLRRRFHCDGHHSADL